MIFAEYSLHSRDSLRDTAALPNHRPGVVIDVIAVAVPVLSMSSSVFASVLLFAVLIVMPFSFAMRTNRDGSQPPAASLPDRRSKA